eukprot:FN605047.1.p3 GENE.FN605047.1~~FN605047.1.p3  ORF type:complete len:52 (-),score=13.89 FN605047.1:14-169(-)
MFVSRADYYPGCCCFRWEAVDAASIPHLQSETTASQWNEVGDKRYYLFSHT